MPQQLDHPWANKQPIELDFLATDVSRDAFMEERQETLEERRGWAPPRKRPRRVHRKLEARGFAAHFGGPRHPAAQRWQVQWRAPVLERLLHQRGDDLVMVAPDYRFEDGELVVATPEQIELGSRGQYEEEVVAAPCLRLDEAPRPPTRVKWRVQRVAVRLQFNLRTVVLSALVHLPAGEVLGLPSAKDLENRAQKYETVASPESVLSQRAHAVLVALAWASRPRPETGGTAARQTSYRPRDRA